MYLSMHVCIHTYVHACVQVSEDVKVMVGYREMLSANSPAARPVHGAVGNKLGFGGRYATIAGREVGTGGFEQVGKGEGSFYMCWEDFYTHFDRIYLCKLPQLLPGRARGDAAGGLGVAGGGNSVVTASGTWSLAAGTAGGCSNHASCMDNPQWRLLVPASTDAVHIRLFQSSAFVAHPRRFRGPGGARNHIGLYVIKVEQELDAQVALAEMPPSNASSNWQSPRGEQASMGASISGRLVAKTRTFSNLWQTSLKLRRQVELAQAQVDEDSTDERQGMECFVIIPCTYDTGAEGRFTIQAMASTCNGPMVLEQIQERASRAEAWGAWQVEAAGGCMNHSTWTRNPCFLLTLPAVDVSGPHSSRRMPPPFLELSVTHDSQSAGLGLYVFHLRGGVGAGLAPEALARVLDRRNVAAESRHFLIGSRVTLSVAGLAAGRYVVMAATFEPCQLLASFRLVCFSPPSAPASLEPLPVPVGAAGPQGEGSCIGPPSGRLEGVGRDRVGMLPALFPISLNRGRVDMAPDGYAVPRGGLDSEDQFAEEMQIALALSLSES